MTATKPTSIVWFRNDLRLDDNRALQAAAAAGGPVIPVFLWTPREEDLWAPGAASRWWLHQSLEALSQALREKGSRLILRRGPSLTALQELILATGASKVFWSRRYEPAVRKRDEQLRAALRKANVETEECSGALLFEPDELHTKSGNPFQVFTPFWKSCLAKGEPAQPAAAPRTLAAPATWPDSLPLEQLNLEPTIDWAAGLKRAWTPGETGTRKQLRKFVQQAITDYKTARDQPGIDGTSRLSPHLHFGEVSVRRVWHQIRKLQERRAAGGERGWKPGPEDYLRQLGWREFAHHLLYHFPHTTGQPLREQFARFPWRRSKTDVTAWRKGQTGYPLVDAGMRELWSTGWMHNRVRMVVGSFLVKDLRISWLEGARWFWDTLVDADLANNTLGWQWVAGCGADAAPYFRIFNPVSQGERFDPQGEYVRRWVPEIARLPNRWIHKPWQAPPEALKTAGIVLGKTYPNPIVDHAVARREALTAFQGLSKHGLDSE
ncbi:MAG: deoxyribodipyrimidine photo-lyase [Bryobacterales bacterium]